MVAGVIRMKKEISDNVKRAIDSEVKRCEDLGDDRYVHRKVLEIFIWFIMMLTSVIALRDINLSPWISVPIIITMLILLFGYMSCKVNEMSSILILATLKRISTNRDKNMKELN